MGRRRSAREYAVQVLFQLDVTGDHPDSALPIFWKGKRLGADVVDFTERLVRGAWQRRREIDSILEEISEHWKVSRMARVDRNVLRLALFELLYEGETPAAVILDEAIEIAKRFGNADSGPFVNGILDGVRRRWEGGELRLAPSPRPSRGA